MIAYNAAVVDNLSGHQASNCASARLESTECLPVRLPPGRHRPNQESYYTNSTAPQPRWYGAWPGPARLEPSRSVAPNDFISRLTSAVDRATCTLRERSVPAFRIGLASNWRPRIRVHCTALHRLVLLIESSARPSTLVCSRHASKSIKQLTVR